MNNVKLPEPTPGWRTTEFWVTLATQLLASLGALHVVSVGDQEILGAVVTKCLTFAGLAIANALVVIAYIRGRVALKQGPEVLGVLRGPVTQSTTTTATAQSKDNAP